MHNSHPIEVQGRFLGIAVTHAAGAFGPLWRFVATDPVVEDLDSATFPSPSEAQRVAGLVLARNSGQRAVGMQQ
jgi:hypothetical protein